ncbi:MAG: hypothetical protein ACKPKO_29945, partial [Candidatus Fonsibacter sp.]
MGGIRLSHFGLKLNYYVFKSFFLFRCGFLAFELCVMQCRCRLDWMSIVGTNADAMHHGEMTWAR